MEDWGGVLDGFVDQIKKTVKEHNKGATSVKQSFQAFLHAVDWTEPWLMALMCGHVFLFVFIIATRNHSNCQTFLFFLLLSLIYLSEPLNSFLSTHWQYFSSQAYFDRNGLFISAVFSGPLIIQLFIILVNSLILMTCLMVKVKRAQIRSKAKESKSSEPKSN
ncbi:hypothetical protein CYMTET_8148 [Cymbomonas tetramitiformis]|uniref:Transmembrane protein 18 n=1 Tax=Cymbomonas tetramitiformis TaxID=36881 RepID=A0AAE0LG58_9CHLO|nr:hypothetical protein CYMTET_8148 [Cymbomonas tetramitiformis]